MQGNRDMGTYGHYGNVFIHKMLTLNGCSYSRRVGNRTVGIARPMKTAIWNDHNKPLYKTVIVICEQEQCFDLTGLDKIKLTHDWFSPRL